MWAVVTFVTSIFSLLLFIAVAVGTALITVWVGIPILVAALAAVRVLANHRRRYSGGLIGRTIASPYLRRPTGNPVARIGALAGDPAVRRDMLWLFADATIGFVLSVIAFVEGILDLIFWWLPPGLAATAHAHLDCLLLAESEKSRLAQRVEHLTETRTETVDAQAAELRRIERDLHDGAQARLVALGMSLAMAEEQLDARSGPGSRPARRGPHLVEHRPVGVARPRPRHPSARAGRSRARRCRPGACPRRADPGDRHRFDLGTTVGTA